MVKALFFLQAAKSNLHKTLQHLSPHKQIHINLNTTAIKDRFGTDEHAPGHFPEKNQKRPQYTQNRGARTAPPYYQKAKSLNAAILILCRATIRDDSHYAATSSASWGLASASSTASSAGAPLPAEKSILSASGNASVGICIRPRI